MASSSAFLTLFSLFLVAGTLVARKDPGNNEESVMKALPIPEATDHPDTRKEEHGYEKQDPIRDYWKSATGNQPMPEVIQGLVLLGGKEDHFVKDFTPQVAWVSFKDYGKVAKSSGVN